MDEQLLTISNYAETALYEEVALSPKPGLVDRFSNGAHRDMDFQMFLASIQSLRPFFKEYLYLGLTHRGQPSLLFDSLRETGKMAETAMLKATKGINTHKGANFSFAVLLGATGLHLQSNIHLPFAAKDTQKILSLSQDITQDVVAKDFQQLTTKQHLSYGEELYLKYQISGIRGEAANGYPALQKLMCFLRKHQELRQEELLLRALLYLMSEVEDSNILHRGGRDALKEIKKESLDLQKSRLSYVQLVKKLKEYDQQLTTRYLSPGGSADLLSLGIYFSFLEKLFSPSGKKV